jgi:hypothetical protein
VSKATATTRQPPPFRLNKEQTERAAGVKFDPRAWSKLQSSAEYCELYADPGARARRAPLFMMKDWGSPHTRRERADIRMRLVAQVSDTFHASGGTNRERLTRLIVSLFKQAGVRPPAARTLRQAVASATDGWKDPLL